MDWQWLADFFVLTPPLLVIFVLLYVAPLGRAIFFPVRSSRGFLAFVNRCFGYWEYLIAPLRDSFGFLFLGGLLIASAITQQPLPGAIAVVGIGLTIWSRYQKRRSLHKLMEFVKRSPPMHPQEFFNHFFASHGLVQHRLPAAPLTALDPLNADFRREGLPRFRFALLRGVWSTILIMRIGMKAFRWKGAVYLREIASAFAVLWGLRLMQLIRGQIIVEGKERLEQRSRWTLYVSNHTSFFDFVVLPLAVGTLPRFLLAKDHFVDNPIIHRALGLGKVANALGMIFVDRRQLKFSPGTSDDERRRQRRIRAAKCVDSALERFIGEGLPIALYPQGTRARLTLSASGARLGAGYYSVGKLDRLQAEGGYLKKGAAYVGINAALTLRERCHEEIVTIVPLAVVGAAVACPRKSFSLKLGTTIRVRIGELLEVTPQMVSRIRMPALGEEVSGGYREAVQGLHQRIDRALTGALKIRGELEGRFLEIIRERGDANGYEEVNIALRAWRGDDPLVHVILDYIFACPPDKWRSHIGQLAHRLTTQAPREELVALKNEIAREIA